MPGFDLGQRRRHAFALVARHIASGVELAPLGRADGARDVALQQDAFLLQTLRIGRRDGREKRDRVGMARIAEGRFGVRELDDVPEVHHADPVGNVPDDRKVVRDEHIGQFFLLFQFLEQVDNLGLDRHVKRRNALVADDELRHDRQRPRDADTLSLTAGELVRIAVEHILLQTALFHRIDDVLPHLRGSGFEEFVGQKPFLDDLPDRETRVEGRIGILEDDLQIAAQEPHLVVFQAGEVDAVVTHRFELCKLLVVRVATAEFVELGVDVGDLFFDGLKFGLHGVLFRRERLDLRPDLLRLLFVERLVVFVGGETAVELVDPDLEIVKFFLVSFSLFREQIETLEQLFPLVALVDRVEAAQNVHDVRQPRFDVAVREVQVLQQVEVGFFLAARLLEFLFEFRRLFVRARQFLRVAGVVTQRVENVGRRQLVEGHAVVERRARGLIVKLQQYAPERRFSASGLAHDPKRLALVDVEGDVLVRANVELIALEQGGLCNRKILFQISD